MPILMFSGLCLRLSVRLSVCSSGNKHVNTTSYFQNEWADFDATSGLWSMGKGMKRSTAGVRRSKIKVTRGLAEVSLSILFGRVSFPV